MPRGLHLSDVDLEPNDQFTPSSGPQPMASPSPSTARQMVGIPAKKKGKFDPIKVITVYVEDGILEPSNECSQRCTYYFSQKNDVEGVSWKKIPSKTKDFYWGEFKKYITYPGYNVEVIKKAWTTKVSIRYKDWISKLSQLETKPDDEGIDNSTWDAWKKYWKTDEFQEKSSRGKRNRDRNGKGMVNHTGGSQTFKVTLKRMHEENIFPDPSEFHLLTHTYKTRPGILCDDKAIQVHADYSKKTQETLSQLQSQAEVDGLAKPDHLSLAERTTLFKEAAGGEKKSGVYGSGSAISHFYTLERARGGSSSSEVVSSSAEIVEFKEEIIQLKNVVAQQKEERDKVISEAIKKTEKRMYRMVRKIVHNSQQSYAEQESSDNGDDDAEW